MPSMNNNMCERRIAPPPSQFKILKNERAWKIKPIKLLSSIESRILNNSPSNAPPPFFFFEKRCYVPDFRTYLGLYSLQMKCFTETSFIFKMHE